jgi:hypothetical protein
LAPYRGLRPDAPTACNSSGNGGTYGYYYCLNRACPMRAKSLRSSIVHPEFSALLGKLKTSPSGMDAIETKLRDLWAKRRGTSGSSQENHTEKLRELGERRKRVFEMREDGSYDLPTFKERLRGVDAEIAAVTPPETARSIADLDIETVVQAARWLLARVPEAWRQATTPATRLRFERIAFPRGIRRDTDGAIRTVIPGLLFALSDESDASVPVEVGLAGFISNPEAEYEYFRDLIDFHRDLNDPSVPRDEAAWQKKKAPTLLAPSRPV